MRSSLLMVFVLVVCGAIGIQHYQVHEETQMYRDATRQAQVEQQHNMIVHEKQQIAAMLTQQVAQLSDVVKYEAQRADNNEKTARHFANKYVQSEQRANMLEYLLRMTTYKLQQCEEILGNNNLPVPAGRPAQSDSNAPCDVIPGPEKQDTNVDKSASFPYKQYGNSITQVAVHPR